MDHESVGDYAVEVGKTKAAKIFRPVFGENAVPEVNYEIDACRR